LPKIEEDGKGWLRRPKLYKGVVEKKRDRLNANVYVSDLEVSVVRKFSIKNSFDSL
jgi:hypothetical protein